MASYMLFCATEGAANYPVIQISPLRNAGNSQTLTVIHSTNKEVGFQHTTS